MVGNDANCLSPNITKKYDNHIFQTKYKNVLSSNWVKKVFQVCDIVGYLEMVTYVHLRCIVHGLQFAVCPTCSIGEVVCIHSANVCAATRIRRKLKLCATEKVLSAVVHII